MAFLGLAALASCANDGPAIPSPAQAAATSPGVVDVDMPNSLPESATNRDMLNSGAGVVGVTHLPP